MPLAPLVVKATIVFEQGGNGWTESFWWQGIGADLTLQSAALKQIVDKRRLLLGVQSAIRAYKVSFETGTGGEVVLQDAFLRYYGQAGFSTEKSDAADTALLLNWKDATGQRNKMQFMRGIWDNIVTDGGAYDPAYGTWSTKLGQWLAQMYLPVAGVKGTSVGWIRRTPIFKRNIIAYTTDANGYTTFTLDVAIPQGTLQPTLTGLPFATPLEARIAKLNTTSNLNGQILVAMVTTTTCKTVKPIATIPFRQIGTIQFYDANLMVVGVDATSGLPSIYAQKIVERKVGAPLLESRGRRKARVRA